VLNCPPTPQGVLLPSPSPSPPCYRCVFPRPPPPESVVSCGEGGILGPVVGVMGVLQALEAVRILAAGLHLPPAAASAAAPSPPPPPTLLLFSGAGGAGGGPPSFRAVRMRTRRRECFACGEGSAARLSLGTMRSGSLDYVAFCGGPSGPVKVLEDEERVSASAYYRELMMAGKKTTVEGGGGGYGDDNDDDTKPVLLDVREKELFDVASIEGAVNIPYSTIQSSARTKRPEAEKDDGAAAADTGLPDWVPPGLSLHAPIYVVCRVGNDSQHVAKQLKDLGLGRGGERFIGDIRGGMRAWKEEVDSTLPFL
jgi:adenylyltransferase and sulfurtransferase